MSELASKTSEKSYCPWHLALTISLFLSLFISLSDALGILPYELAKTSTFWLLLKPLAGKITIIAAAYWLIWLLVVPLLGRVLKLDVSALSFALAAFIAVLYRLYSLHIRIGFGSFPSDIRKPIVISGVALTVVVFSVGSYFLARFLSKLRWGSVVGAICLAILFILAETAVAMWLNKCMLEPLLSHRELLREKLFSLPVLLTNAGYLLCIAATVFIFIRMHRRSLPVRLLQGFTLVVFISSMMVVSGVLGKPNMRQPAVPVEHPIRHVILIVIDTLRADTVSCYGGSRVSTPNIDRLAADGILFERAYAPAPWTAPSMGSVLTGLSPFVHKTTTYKSNLPNALPTLAERMRRAGYLTWAVGTNLILRRRNFEQGFVGFEFFPKRKDHTPCGRILESLFPRKFASEASTRDLTDISIDWLDCNCGRDFFMWLHYFDPHEPYEPPDEFLAGRKLIAGIGKRFGDKVNVRAGLRILSQQQREAVRTLYDCEVLYVDKNVGRLLDYLKKLNIYDQSLIILTSDHGEEFWEHDGYEHGHTLYNELLHVPLIIKLPAMTSKGRIKRPVSLEGITPTVMEICGVGYNPGYLSGDSLVPIWSAESQIDQENLLFSTGLLFYEEKESVIFGGMKYIKSLVSGSEELYDLTSDYGETTCLVQNRTRADEVEKARELLRQYRKKVQVLRQHYLIEAEQTHIDRDTMEQLRSLGYVK